MPLAIEQRLAFLWIIYEWQGHGKEAGGSKGPVPEVPAAEQGSAFPLYKTRSAGATRR